MQLAHNPSKKEPKVPKHDSRSGSAGELSLLLSDLKNPESLQTLMRLVYDELLNMADRHLRKERPGDTWQPTVLVNEACIRLIESGASFKNRRHFFGAAAQTMRRLIIDSVRRRKAQKRGGQWQRIDFGLAEQIGFEQSSDLFDFDAALSRLHNVQPSLSEVVKLRVFGGWSTREIGTILGIGQSTARRRWALARNWIRGALAGSA